MKRRMDQVTIWYVSNLQRCNFSCSYCVTGQPSIQKQAQPATWQLGQDVHDRVVDWLIAQPYAIKLRMNSIGEPFVSKPYLDSVARLSRASNLSFVEILTNGSF